MKALSLGMQILYSIAVRFIRCILYVAPISGKTKQFAEGRKRIWNQINNIPNDKEVIWMHCASLGEYEQGLPILNALKAREPESFYLITFFSPSGRFLFFKKSKKIGFFGKKQGLCVDYCYIFET